MKLSEFYNDKELDEIVPAISTATAPGGTEPQAGNTTPPVQAPKGQMPTDPMKAAADAKAAQAQAAKDKQEQIKATQEAIKAKEQELMDLRTKIAELQKM